jgi:Tfp pilus assembly protein PilV
MGVGTRPIEHDEDGFSLIEAMLASGVLAVGVLALAQLFAVATQGLVVAARTTSAAVLAAQKVEELRSAGCCVAEEGGDRIGEYARTWSVRPLPLDPAGAVVIQVSVTPGGVRLVTVLTKTVP